MAGEIVRAYGADPTTEERARRYTLLVNQFLEIKSMDAAREVNTDELGLFHRVADRAAWSPDSKGLKELVTKFCDDMGRYEKALTTAGNEIVDREVCIASTGRRITSCREIIAKLPS